MPNKKTWKGFKKIFKDGDDNETCYFEAADKLLEFTETGGTSCCFTYGHTGSGKTHTIFGYGQEMGLFQFAACKLEQILDNIEQSTNTLKYFVEVRFAEVLSTYSRFIMVACMIFWIIEFVAQSGKTRMEEFISEVML